MISPEPWRQAWRDLGAMPPCDLFQRLLDAYGEPQRKYHTLQHLAECLERFDDLRHCATHPAEVELALWFHDAVYSVSEPGNERNSAAWACAAMRDAGAPEAAALRVAGLVMATCHDAVPSDKDAEILVDVDLSILGAAPSRFAQYERQIRAEYAHVPDALFAAKRGEILRGFRARPHIFSTPLFRQRYEAQARANLAKQGTCKNYSYSSA